LATGNTERETDRQAETKVVQPTTPFINE